MKTTDNRLYPAIKTFLCEHLPLHRSASKHTIRAYRHALSDYLDFAARRRSATLGELDIGDVNSATVLAYLDALEDGGRCSVHTRNHRLNCIRSFLSYAADDDVSMRAVWLDVRHVPFKKVTDAPTVKYMSEKAVAAILNTPSPKTRKGLRDLAILATLYDTGARVGELSNLRVEDVNVDDAPQMTLRGKGRKTRVVPLSNRLAAIIRKYVAAFLSEDVSASTPLFYTKRGGQKARMSEDNIRLIVKDVAARARRKCKEVPERVHPHMFRHSRATHLYQNGMSLELVSQWLGHAAIETTLVYARADTEMKRKAIEKAMSGHQALKATIKTGRMQLNDDDMIKRLYGLK